MQGRPGKEPGFIEQQADDDQRDESAGGVPDDFPHQRDIADVDHPTEQRQHGAEYGAPADAQALGLPDHQGNGQQENQ
ncbi:hypothetical protein D3C71_1921200 [compost metagenome]